MSGHSEMRLWLLRRLDVDQAARTSYDEMYGFVVAAPDERAARAQAQANAGDEQDEYTPWPNRSHTVVDFWTDAARASCAELRPEGYREATVILCDFNAG